MSTLVNHEVEANWFGNGELVTVDSVMEPFKIMDEEVQVVKVTFKEGAFDGIRDVGTQILKLSMKSDYRYAYAFYNNGKLITFHELAENLVYLDSDVADEIQSEFSEACEQTMLTPVYADIADGRRKSVVAFVTDPRNLEGEITPNNPYASQMKEALQNHAHIAKFTMGLFNTMFNRFNIAHMPKAEDVAYTIMNGEYLNENGELKTMSIKDVEEFIEAVKSHIRIGSPSSKG